MAKSIVICFKNKPKEDLKLFADLISSQLTPDNIDESEPYIYIKDRIFSCTVNPSRSVRFDQGRTCLGLIEDFTDEQWKPKIPIGDGTFALFRFDAEYFEVVSDYVASRTIWYVHNEDYLIASTSQRMIITFLGDLRFNDTAVRWMLSAGLIGPGQSWDTRIKPLPGNSVLLLNRNEWKSSIKYSDSHDEHRELHEVDPIVKPVSWHKENFEEALKESMLYSNIDFSNWTLALSGGIDSRSILFYLKDKKDIKCITWGLSGARSSKDNDAYIASTLASICKFQHDYIETDIQESDFKNTLNRFLVAGEGRIDHLSGYMDGLQLWKKLCDSGFGILRGYDAQGATPRKVTNERQARFTTGLICGSDYKNSIIPDNLKVSENDIPQNLKKKTSESIEQYRDRLWLSFRTPVLTAALDEIKTAYVEILNPLLFKRIVKAFEILPDELRNDKFLFRTIIDETFPEIQYAKRDAVQDIGSILNNKEIKKYLKQELLEVKDSGVLSHDLVMTIVNSIEESAHQRLLIRKLRDFYRSYTPKLLKGLMKSYYHKNMNYIPMDTRRIALRALLVIKMNKMLSNDAKLGREILQKN